MTDIAPATPPPAPSEATPEAASEADATAGERLLPGQARRASPPVPAAAYGPPGLLERLESAAFARLNRSREWHELPAPLGLLNLAVLREDLRRHNLHDTFGAGGERDRRPTVRPAPYRSYDGSGYDPYDVDMGRVGTRLDRNAPLHMAFPEDDESLMAPSPREISRELLARRGFVPAPTLNLLAAAWIQFQNHGWANHGDNEEAEPFTVPLAADDDWAEQGGGCPMRVNRTRPDPVAHTSPDAPPTYENTVTHWWDGSQIYGSDEARCRSLRTGEHGKLILTDGRLPADPRPGMECLDATGMNSDYWAGLSLLHTLFAKEHNAICDLVRSHHPTWDDERLFHTARLVNTALMAKIHTVEWTPGILDTPLLQHSMNANWHGLLPRWVTRRFGRIGGEALGGILGSRTEHHAAPFSMTEEFVSAYRLHPLIPDEITVRDHRRGGVRKAVGFDDMQGATTRTSLDEYGTSDLMYTFGVSHPGALVLHNHPDALRNLTRLSGERIDLGTVDILRDRERGIPRYNAYRQMLRKRPVTSFEELTGGHPGDTPLLRELYDGRLDRVDTLVGNLAEPRPAGFGFSDTLFRIFILMASRRLKSDRFFTTDYRPEVYTAEGLRWVDRNSMVTVLLRHHPELAPALDGVSNAFAPWKERS
ncbi:peroxidase family protein [Streptomyces sp. Isolate_45]|uniref:peroxidase family protein n=1 Tax=Streptomyces sp. Isolate_45 TaxID=2950111 RepID=UPI00248203D4|nr:peroxidase family protein [Streptomyces sp. Isolate_45]MDA5284491.1 peroxidase [Streptomyces sp. Isolate_45]